MKYSIKACKLLINNFWYYIIIKIYYIFSSVIQSLIPIYVMNKVVSIYVASSMLKEDIKLMMIVVLVAFFIMFLLKFITVLFEMVEYRMEEKFSYIVSKMLYSKMKVIDYDFQTDPKFLNDYTRSLEMGVYNIYILGQSTFQLITKILQSISVLLVIFSMHPLTIVFAILLGFGYFLVRVKMSKLTNSFRKEQEPHRRKTWYSNRAFTLKDSMADLKTSNIEEILLENNDSSYDEIIKCTDKYIFKRSILSSIGEILMASLYPIILALLAYLTITDLNIASFASLTVAATTLSGLISNLVSILGDLQDANVESKVSFDLLDKTSVIEGVKYKDVEEDFETIDLDNVTFKYKDKTVLENVTMHIKKHEKIAIVGSNGAGKTTLVKLLLRLYDPFSGDIYINNQNYKDTTATSLREKVGAVFQNVEVYALSIAENIIFKTPQTDSDIKLINDALKFSGLYDYVYSLKDNINTMVTREFDKSGVVFSGGQIQRLAIARGYAQSYQLLILDEPSSALDPIAEATVYKNLLLLGKEKTIIFISHRLTTTVNADKIYLFDKGKIVEEGTHSYLMSINGLYKKMFISQANKYIGDEYE